MHLAKELQAVGCQMAPDQFNELICRVHKELYAHWTDEELVFHLDDAKRFCGMVRVECQAPVSDYVICRALTNRRKRGERSDG
jgi:uncharacterized protein CbrC (UPF0167 family)